MAIQVLMPKLGWDSTEGSLVEWVKRDGDVVKPGDVICLIEGDKAVTEVETLDAGVLRIPANSPPIGQKAPIGTLIAYIVPPDASTDLSISASTSSAAQPGQASASVAAVQSVSTTIPSTQPAEVGPNTVSRGANGRPDRLRISPRARRLARELNVDPSALVATGAIAVFALRQGGLL